MKRSFTSTLVLAVVLAGLVTWYFIYEKKMRPQSQEAEEKTKQLVTLGQNDITELTIERLKAIPADGKPHGTPEYEIIQLKKTGAEWSLVKPLEYSADGGAVGAMVNALTTMKQERTVEDKPKDLQPFGLASPKIKVSARKDATAPAQEVLIGNDTPVGFSNYAKLTGAETVYRVPRTLFTTFDKDAKSLRNKSVLSLSRFEVTEAEIQRPGENIVLKKEEGKDNWTLARENLPADGTEWNKTLNTILELKATDFAAEKTTKLGDFGLNPPQVKVTLSRVKDQPKIVLWIGKTKKAIYAKLADRDTIFEVAKETLEKVDRPGASYRDLRLATFNRFDVKRVKLTRGTQTLDLVKKDVNWTDAADPNAKLDNVKVDSLLTQLQDAKVAKYLTASSAVKQPSMTVALYEGTEATAPEKVLLKFAAPKNNLVAGERAGLSLPFALNEADWKRFDVTRAYLAAPEPKAPAKDAAPDAPKLPERKEEPTLIDGKKS